MRYEFQDASHVDEFVRAVEGSEEFIVRRDATNGIIVMDYVFTCPTTFPDPMTYTGDEHRKAILRRDCRGIKFDLETGEIVTRPYHKFFNVNEKPETQVGVIDWSQPHIVIEKLDGSMITPFRRKDGVFQWHSMMGPTMVAKPVHDHTDERYVAFADAMREEGLTPIFEWCSRKQRIVIDYPQDQLVLTGLRHTKRGTYVPYAKMSNYAAPFGIPVVRAIGSVEDIQEFLNRTAEIEQAEGFVIRFLDGHMCKVKGAWYCRIHNTKEIFVFEKNVWNIVLTESVDDAKPFMDDHDRKIIEDFSNEFDRRMRIKACALLTFVNQARETGVDRKTFASETVLALSKPERSLAFRVWDGVDPVEAIREMLLKNIGSQSSVDRIRDLIGGLKWQDFYDLAT